MKRIAMILVIAGGLVSPWEIGMADPVSAFKPGTVTEQQNEIPAADTPLGTIMEGLESERTETKEGALLWLLQRNNATNLSYFSFPRHSIRFGIDRVIKKQADTILWRLVECRYVSRSAMQSGAEYRAVWKVAYLFDDFGQLRDWIENYDLLLADDFNLDKRIEILTYIKSPKRVMILSYDRGRSRELLNVDDVPRHGREISRTPGERGGEYVKYAPPVEVVGGADDKPGAIRIAGRGTYLWDARKNKYMYSAPTETSPDKK
jgi:hypothetical protein